MKVYRFAKWPHFILIALFVLLATGLGHSSDEHDVSSECEVCLHLEHSALAKSEVETESFAHQIYIEKLRSSELFLQSFAATYKALRAPPFIS